MRRTSLRRGRSLNHCVKDSIAADGASKALVKAEGSVFPTWFETLWRTRKADVARKGAMKVPSEMISSATLMTSTCLRQRSGRFER